MKAAICLILGLFTFSWGFEQTEKFPPLNQELLQVFLKMYSVDFEQFFWTFFGPFQPYLDGDLITLHSIEKDLQPYLDDLKNRDNYLQEAISFLVAYSKITIKW